MAPAQNGSKIEYKRPVDVLGAETPIMVQPLTQQDEFFRSPAVHGALNEKVVSRAVSPTSAILPEESETQMDNVQVHDSENVQLEEGTVADAVDSEVVEDVLISQEQQPIDGVLISENTNDTPNAEVPTEPSVADSTPLFVNPWTTLSKYVQANQHLMSSAFYRQLLLIFQGLYEQGKIAKQSPQSPSSTDEAKTVCPCTIRAESTWSVCSGLAPGAKSSLTIGSRIWMESLCCCRVP
jgi:hypothetical protein